MLRNHLYIILSAVALFVLCEAKSPNRARYGAMGSDFERAMAVIERHYIEPVDRRKMFESAMNGLVTPLGDPYSAYMPPKDWAPLKETLEQQFGGVGIEVAVNPETKQLVVISPLVGTPASEAGVLAGDVILAIDGASTAGFTVEDARAKLRGELGAPVTLRVLHEGDAEPVDLSLRRANIEVQSVLGDTRDASGHWRYVLKPQQIGYLRISEFGDKTVAELEAVLNGLKSENLRGLILDVRNDPGGALESAVKACDLFLNSGHIVSTRDRAGRELQRWEATPGVIAGDIPIVVLANRYSASASEILAACLQDQNRAKVVGERTFGKGTVQTLFELQGGESVLRITTAGYWRPSGKNIHRPKDAPESAVWGVHPDEGCAVPQTEAEFAKWVEWRRNRDRAESKAHPAVNGTDAFEADPALKKAIELLSK